MIFSSPVTPTRDRLTPVDGRRAWTSLDRTAVRSLMSTANCTADTLVQTARMCRTLPDLGSTPPGNWPPGSAPRGAPADYNSIVHPTRPGLGRVRLKERPLDEARGSSAAGRGE